MIAFLAQAVLLAGCSGSLDGAEVSRILGVSEAEIEDSERIFGSFAIGEGYTLEAYALSGPTIEQFLAHEPKTLPDDHRRGKRWKKVEWSATPVDLEGEYKAIFDEGVSCSYGNEAHDDRLREIRTFLGASGAYYSFYYTDTLTSPGDIRLFMLNPANKELFVVDWDM